MNIGKIQINAIEWYVPHYNPSLDQQRVLMKQIVDKTPPELRHPERFVYMKEVKTQNLWTFELGTHEGVNVPIWVFIGSRQSDRENDQNLNNVNFYRMPVTSAQCIIGTEKYPDTAISLNYDDDVYSHGYGLIKEAFRALLKDIILQP